MCHHPSFIWTEHRSRADGDRSLLWKGLAGNRSRRAPPFAPLRGHYIYMVIELCAGNTAHYYCCLCSELLFWASLSRRAPLYDSVELNTLLLLVSYSSYFRSSRGIYCPRPLHPLNARQYAGRSRSPPDRHRRCQSD